jgi:predicted permease
VVVSRIIAQFRSLWRTLRHRGAMEAEMSEEFRHHLELRTEDLVRSGISPTEAARRARIEFGHIDSHKDDARVSRGLRRFEEIGFSLLDLKLGLRMLMKYPGLTVVSVIGMSVAVAVGAGTFGFFSSMLDPQLPLPDGERLVSIQNANVRNPGNPDRQSLHDFMVWRDELTSVTNLSAYLADSRNLVVPGQPVELVRIAQMTASSFRAAQTAPELGRPLLDEDEHAAAPPVVVMAYDEWQRRFEGDPGIVGREVRLGSDVHTVVGVMPEGFHFPVNHRYWVPLPLHPMDFERGSGPALFTFARLADGATLGDVQAELTAIRLRLAAAYPETNEHLRPQVLPYTHDYFDIDSPAMAWAMRAVQLAVSLLLVVVAVNVAILVYARTATRAGEIAVRSALGASRRRVVSQLFAEALVLSGVAALIGLTLAGIALGQIEAFQRRTTDGWFPFWFDLGLSPGLVFYVAGLATLAAIIVGVLPALQATGRRVQAGLQRLGTHGSEMQLGRTWTVLIVAQVTVAVAALPMAAFVSSVSIQRGMAKPGYAPEQYLRANLSMERVEAPPNADAAEYDRVFDVQFRDRAARLLRRLEADPGVAGVTFAGSFPGSGRFSRIEIENTGSETETRPEGTVSDQSAGGVVRTNEIGVDLFNVFDVPIVAGRGFVDGDAREGSNAVIVDEIFADEILGGQAVLGRNIRLVRRVRNEGVIELERGPWLEIVGVVPDFTVQFDFDPPDPKVYLPLEVVETYSGVTLVVRVRDGTAPGFAERLTTIAAGIDPALQLHELRRADDAQWEMQQAILGLALVIVGVTASVLLLSAAGIYAMMSFTVAKRRNEIGIRTALGAEPRQILSGIFARASGQLAAGLVTGLVLAVAIDRAVGGGPLAHGGVVLLPIVAALMLAIGLTAALGPARKALSVQPTEALREE